MGTIVEGLWDCPYCGQTGIGGLKKQCPNCGHPQDEGTKFYLGIEKKVLSSEIAKNYGKGADWTCSYCNSLNRFSQTECANCGGPREESSGDYFENREKQKEKERDEEKDGSGQEHMQKCARLTAGEKQPKGGAQNKKWSRFAILGALFLLLLLLFWPKKQTAVVVDKAWNRSIEVEEYTTVRESDWSIPSSGREYDRRQEIHHYNHVIDHYETVQVQKTRQVLDGYDTHTEYADNGDGTFTSYTVETPRYRTEYYTQEEEQPVYRDDPIYRTKYYYEIERWIVNHTVDTKGKTDAPYWGEVVLTDKQRQGARQEEYTVYFETKKGKKYDMTITENEWNRLQIGDKKKLVIQFGTIKEIKD